MSVVKHKVRRLLRLVHDPDALGQLVANGMLAPVHGTPQIAMPQHAPAQKRQRDILGEEDAPDASVDVAERVADAPQDKVLKRRGISHEYGLRRGLCQVALPDEAIGKLENCVVVSTRTDEHRGRTYAGTGERVGQLSRSGRDRPVE